MKSIHLLYLLIPLISCKSASQTTLYQLNVTISQSSVTGSINDFPLFTKESKGQSIGTYLINLHLKETQNELKISLNETTGEDAFVDFSIVPYGQSDIVDTNDRSSIVLKGRLDKKKTSGAWQFDVENTPVFNNLFTEAPMLEKREVAEYTQKLLGLMGKGDVSALVEEMEPKLRDVSEITGQRVRDLVSAQYKPVMFRDRYLGASHLPKVIGDLELIAHSDGRIWELARKNGNALLHKTVDGRTNFMEVFVAKIDGQLKIVR